METLEEIPESSPEMLRFEGKDGDGVIREMMLLGRVRVDEFYRKSFLCQEDRTTSTPNPSTLNP